MVTMPQITRFVREVVREFKPEKVILFGSYAEGRATEDSDVDLLVVLRHRGDNVDKGLEIRHRVDRSFPLDLLVKKPEEARRWASHGDSFFEAIVNDGRTLYARRYRRVGREG